MALRYYIEPKSIKGEAWRLEIHDKDYVGTASEINGGQIGFSLDYEGDASDPFFPIFPSSLTFDFLVETSAHETFLTELANAREEQFSIVLKRGASLDLEWVGWLVTDQIQQRDQYYPYHTTLYAVDGIARLSGIEYKDKTTGSEFSGRQTHLQHILNCLSHVDLRSLSGVTYPSVYLRTNVNWYSNGMVTTTSPIAQAEIDNEVFKKKDAEGNTEIWNVYDVLKALCTVYGARLLFSKGSWVLMQVGETENATQKFHTFDTAGTLLGTETSVDIDIDIDYSTSTGAKKLAGGIYTYLPPLKKACVDYHHLTHNNRAFGLSWPDAGTGYVTLPGPVTVDADDTTQISLVFNFKVKSFITITVPLNLWPVHRYKFKLYLKVGPNWIRRYQVGDFYDQTPEEAYWTSLEDYIEIQSPIITQPLNNQEVSFQFKMTSPFMTTLMNGYNIELKLVLDGVYGPGGTVIVNGSGSYYNSVLDWYVKNPNVTVLDEGLGDNPDGSTQRHCAKDSTSGNTFAQFIDTYIGDGPQPYSVSKMTINSGATDTATWTEGGTGTGYPISERLAREVMRVRQRAAMVYQGGIVKDGYWPYYRIIDGTNALWPLRLTLNAFNDIWHGEFIRVARVFTPVSDPTTYIYPPGTIPAPEAETTPVRSDVGRLNPYTIAQAVAIATLDGDNIADTVNTPTPNELTINPVSFTFVHAGDKIKLVNPANGVSQILTVAEDYVPNATKLKITEDLTEDYPDESLILQVINQTASGSLTGFAEQFTSVTNTSVTVSAGTMPNPSIVGTNEIIRRVKVWRSGIRQLYSVNFTLSGQVVTFTQKLRDEDVLIEVVP